MITLGITAGQFCDWFNVEIENADRILTDFDNHTVTVFLKKTTTIDIYFEANPNTGEFTHLDVIDVNFASILPEHHGKAIIFSDVKSMEMD